MGLNNSKRTDIAERRAEVARLRLRGNTQREIADKLNVSLGTINSDIRAIEAEWRERATIDVQSYKGCVLAELSEVKRAAWASRDFRVVLQAIKAECDLLGLDAPTRLEQNVTVNDAREWLAQQFDRLSAATAETGVAQHLN